MRKYFRLVCLLLASLLICSLISCMQIVTVPQSQFNSQELKRIEENKFNEFYSEMKLHVDKANSLIMDLYYFDWGKIGSIGRISGMPGLQVPDEGSYFVINNQVVAFQPLTKELPGKKDIEFLVREAEKCLHFASNIWSNSPYKEPGTAVSEVDQSILNQWRSHCTELSQQLSKTETQMAEFKTVMQNTDFANMESTLNGWDWVKENYLPAFQKSSAKYIELIDSTIAELREAQRYASQLTVWEFTSLSGGEN